MLVQIQWNFTSYSQLTFEIIWSCNIGMGLIAITLGPETPPLGAVPGAKGKSWLRAHMRSGRSSASGWGSSSTTQDTQTRATPPPRTISHRRTLTNKNINIEGEPETGKRAIRCLNLVNTELFPRKKEYVWSGTRRVNKKIVDLFASSKIRNLQKLISEDRRQEEGENKAAEEERKEGERRERGEGHAQPTLWESTREIRLLLVWFVSVLAPPLPP